MPTATRGGCSTRWKRWPRPRRAKAGRSDRRLAARGAGRAHAPLRQGRRTVLRHHQRAAQKSVRGSDPMPRSTGWCACSTVAPTRATWRAGWCAWPAKDIGLADPARCASRWTPPRSYERLGSPEGELALAQCVVYLAVAPKSNAVLQGLQRGAAWREKDGTARCPASAQRAQRSS